ncbi:hypothetical protein OEZ85_002263 [Tetradesmus obliquus]|uniref:Adenylate cyclase-associated CAP C-terminal domain-containing protein n=1 Tax=Tetradesmus obliquus TaxID=3088 RepID=A0ABY8U5A9_TETOB|nr:hypothetical protein OEZ85_002263 [Tetradesmus obliquus]
MVTYNKTKISAAEFLSKPGVTAFQALQICYRHAMFGDMTAKSVEETLSRAAGRVSVIIALRLHLLRGGAAETLHNQLAAAGGSAEIPAAWLDELLPLVQHDQGSVWRSCKPPRGGHVSTRQFALNLAQQRPVCGALPTVSKVVGVFGAGPSRRTADGIWQAIQSVCSQDPALRRLLQQLQQATARVVTAKLSEVNLLVLAANPDAEDVAEHAVPEQFISTFVNGKLVTTAASHGGC